MLARLETAYSLIWGVHQIDFSPNLSSRKTPFHFIACKYQTLNRITVFNVRILSHSLNKMTRLSDCVHLFCKYTSVGEQIRWLNFSAHTLKKSTKSQIKQFDLKANLGHPVRESSRHLLSKTEAAQTIKVTDNVKPSIMLRVYNQRDASQVKKPERL